ncbi:hypothetical protein [Amycolatopsis alba]|uniref:O-linked N-acetylglucosamine transferase n=2 Tax=Amycolatopsis TaxID=1813 RepID=A0A229RAT0_AMYAL|nr:hypothetical protein [Amycolatopsis alba]OXM43589.1 hypothetical protein CFP75_37835 [Amycolatopsis alba DSM 44262]QGJ79651.1 O-linked N-acetylglucosamine transferase [Amycolatopsis sp. CP2808]
MLVAEELHTEIRRLSLRLANARADPLVEAGLACLEAAERVCAALGERHTAADSCQEALNATRAATLAIRFAMAAEAGIRE